MPDGSSVKTSILSLQEELGANKTSILNLQNELGVNKTILEVNINSIREVL